MEHAVVLWVGRRLYEALSLWQRESERQMRVILSVGQHLLDALAHWLLITAVYRREQYIMAQIRVGCRARSACRVHEAFIFWRRIQVQVCLTTVLCSERDVRELNVGTSKTLSPAKKKVKVSAARDIRARRNARK